NLYSASSLADPASLSFPTRRSSDLHRIILSCQPRISQPADITFSIETDLGLHPFCENRKLPLFSLRPCQKFFRKFSRCIDAALRLKKHRIIKIKISLSHSLLLVQLMDSLPKLPLHFITKAACLL